MTTTLLFQNIHEVYFALAVKFYLCVSKSVCAYMHMCVLCMNAEHTCFYKCVEVRGNFVEGSSPSPFTRVPEIEVRKILLPALSSQ